jgi:hypothetical protein
VGGGHELYSHQTLFVPMAEVSVDWESRKYYLLGSFTHMDNRGSHNPIFSNEGDNHQPSSKAFGKYKLRAGFAPFLGEFEDLNVWYIVQVDRDTLSDETDLTQMFRFYFRNTLWEIGASFRGHWMINYMIHF